MSSLIDKQMNEHIYDVNGGYLLDEIVTELKKPGWKEAPKMAPEEEKRFVGRDLFFASSGTITDNLMWALRVLAVEDDAQEKLRAAIGHLSDEE